MPGQLTRKAIASQPEWLQQVPERVGDRRLPEGARVLFTGCGTSFHAALACGPAAQALEVVLGNAPESDVLVAISHEGGTALTLEAIRSFEGETWLITGAAESAIAKAADNVVVATPAIEESYCHTVSYTCAVAAGRALRGEDVSGLAAEVFRELDAEPLGVSEHNRFVVAGAGRDAATVLEAVLKLREGAHVAAEAHHTEQLLHGHLAAIDPSVRCFVLEGEGRAAERAVDAMLALGELGCDALLVPTTHPVVDIVRFQQLTCDLAEARGVDPDMIRWDEEPWNRARKRKTSWPIRKPVDEAKRLPALVDRAALVVDEPVREPDLLHRLEGEIAVDLRRFLRPSDPQAVRGVEPRLQRVEAPFEIPARRREEDDDPGARLRPELLGERRAGVVLTRGHAKPRIALPLDPQQVRQRRPCGRARARRARSRRAAGTSGRRRAPCAR